MLYQKNVASLLNSIKKKTAYITSEDNNHMKEPGPPVRDSRMFH